MRKRRPKISQSFQLWLFVLVIIAFLATTAFLWVFQTRLSEENAVQLLELNIADVQNDIYDTSDDHLLELTRKVAEEVNAADEITSEFLQVLTEQYDVSEVNYINSEGIIVASTYADFIQYDMRSGAQSAEFLVLLEHGQKEFAQKYQPTSYDNAIFRKYAAIKLDGGGFIQVGYNKERFRWDIDSYVKGATRNRHVGEGGSIIVSDSNWTIVSDRHGKEGKKLYVTGIQYSQLEVPAGEVFEATIYGELCYCMYQMAEGYWIIAALPKAEAALSRNVSVSVTTAMQIIVFASLFVMIYILVKKLVVDNIHRINGSLSEITQGKLETVVNVRSHQEFDHLSDDINSTVDTLKKYIADAAARIDAELAFAKAIQHSALPTVCGPYFNRSEFDIWTGVYTAKEVGGDFYDFYFVDENTLAILIADVSGKGIPAAMFMMTAKALLKNFAESGMSPEEVFAHTNDKLCEGNEANMFVTSWMGLLDIRTGKIIYANAGHNSPLIRHEGGDFQYLQSDADLVLGAWPGFTFGKHELQMQPGDVLYLYTDGVTEATNLEEELYGEERLLALVNKHTGSDARTICEAAKADVDRFVGEAPQFDDITMLCLRYRAGKEGFQMKELNINATVENIPVVTAFVDEQLEALGCPQSAQYQIDVAIDELFGNIAFYAYNPDVGPATVRVEVTEDPMAVVITFIDNGVPYDPLAKDDPDITLSLEERDIGGLGIYMVKQSMDEVAYEYKNGQNVLTIKKHI